MKDTRRLRDFCARVDNRVHQAYDHGPKNRSAATFQNCHAPAPAIKARHANRTATTTLLSAETLTLTKAVRAAPIGAMSPIRCPGNSSHVEGKSESNG